MSDSRFTTHLEQTRAKNPVSLRYVSPEQAKEKKVAAKEAKREEQAAKREAKLHKICALRSQCLRAYKRVGASFKGSGMYCSPQCRATALARKKRAEAAESKN